MLEQSSRGVADAAWTSGNPRRRKRHDHKAVRLADPATAVYLKAVSSKLRNLRECKSSRGKARRFSNATIPTSRCLLT